MTDHGLFNSIYELHEYDEAPISYQLSKYCPIDGIYFSTSIMSPYGGYLLFGKIGGDHRVIWVNTHQAALIGFHQNKIISPLARRL